MKHLSFLSLLRNEMSAKNLATRTCAAKVPPAQHVTSICVIRRTPTCLTSMEFYGTDDSNDVTPDDARRSTHLLARFKVRKFMRECTVHVLATLHVESDRRWKGVFASTDPPQLKIPALSSSLPRLSKKDWFFADCFLRERRRCRLKGSLARSSTEPTI